MADEKHKIRNSVLASLISAALIALFVYIMPGGWAWVFLKGRLAIAVSTTWLGSSLAVPVWLFIILSLLALTAIIVVAIACASVPSVRNVGDEIKLFTEAEFFGIKWRWRYGQNGINNIMAFCPKCDLQVHPTNLPTFNCIDRIAYRCDEGHWQSQEYDCSQVELVDRVLRKIQQEIRRKIEDAKGKTP